ncbi:MAG: alanine--tRNA ligase [Clostridia bacterium]|nr:alanine--tRNA ligase [Clostridia bacterium]
MQNMGLNEIREKFLSFFETKNCLRLDSFSLVPKNDASLLLINSGMAPMKKWFTGAEVPPRKRVTTCQKCIRTPDIESVGKTARHGTFFEMLGNFSFGDYFKHEAIAWAWEFLTKVMEIPEDVLWITVYEEDDEARDIWINEIGVNPERVVKMGKADNFWEHGTGPCGPCSEIHVDRGIEHSCGKPDCKLGCDCDRFMEVWNLVFTQFDKDEDGNYNRLANPNIDTGMGLERLACIMQGVNNLFEVDTVQDTMKHISRIAGVNYTDDKKTDISLRVITDHIRSTVMMVSDGVIPSNEGRGYVLRRLLRRAARHGRLLNIKGEFLYTVADTVIDASKQGYPELDEKREYIKKVIRIEEEKFSKTIEAGLSILNDYIEATKAAGADTLSGADAFKLNDTYGFPIDLTVEICEEQGLQVDRAGFDAALKQQKDTARANRKDGSSWDDDSAVSIKAEATKFVGYDALEAKSEVVGIVADGNAVDAIGAGEEGIIVVKESPFYAEMGGQSGDIGSITGANGKATVVDTKKNGDDIYFHIVKVEEGSISMGDAVTLSVCKKNRMAVCRNHSTTHLLHKALKEVLGTHVAQAGSEVTAKHLRFDFSHFEAMTADEIKAVEAKVNEAILEAMDITVQELNIEDAKKLGATAQFGEKYGETVRVVSMGDYSVEFCGGTHLTNTAQAGLFKIISENGVAAGVRRIEAVTGAGVLAQLNGALATIANVADAIKSTVHDVEAKAAAVVEENKGLKRELESIKSKMANASLGDLLDKAADISGVKLVAQRLADGLDMNALRGAGDNLKQKLDCGVLVLASAADGKVNIVCMATADAVAKGAHAGNIIREVAKTCGGGGGGKPDSAQAGGKDASKLDEALKAAEAVLAGQIK